jgi:hypothetical protein
MLAQETPWSRVLCGALSRQQAWWTEPDEHWHCSRIMLLQTPACRQSGAGSSMQKSRFYQRARQMMHEAMATHWLHISLCSIPVLTASGGSKPLKSLTSRSNKHATQGAGQCINDVRSAEVQVISRVGGGQSLGQAWPSLMTFVDWKPMRVIASPRRP